ncbi:MAG TPA: hypothetical protein VIK33_00810 [Anaerolineae bacterium]
MDDMKVLNHRYELVAWGALSMWIGAITLISGEHSGTGWLGIAIILLGLNVVRYLRKIPMNWFSITLGVMALALGASRLLDSPLPFFATSLIVIGVVLLIRSATPLRTG